MAVSYTHLDVYKRQIQRLLMGAKKRRCMSMSKKRLLSIVVSAVILLSFACNAMAAEKSERYVGDSTVNGSIYQTYYQVDAQTRTGVKKISVSGVLYEKGTIGTWQKVSSCSNSSTTSTCMVSSSFNTKPGKSYRPVSYTHLQLVLVSTLGGAFSSLRPLSFVRPIGTYLGRFCLLYTSRCV